MDILEAGKDKHLAKVEIFKHKDFKNVKIEGNPEIEEINDALQDFDAAAHCLGKLGKEAKEAVPLLIEILGNEKLREGGYSKLDSINLIITDLIRNSDFSANDKITNAFKKHESKLKEKDRISLGRRIDNLRKAKEAQVNVFREVVTEYRYIIGIAILFLGWLSIFALKPLWLLRIYDLFPIGEVRLSGFAGAVTVSIQYLLALFLLRPRVLDAWVKKYVGGYRRKFRELKTVKDREIYVNLPVILNDQGAIVLSGKDLRPTFDQNRACLLIWGEGGSGKTSIACQIGKWSMAEEKEERICEHLMIPILIEQEFNTGDEGSREALKEIIHGHLLAVTGETSRIGEEFLRRLLVHRRVLVILDHFSEMSEKTRSKVRPSSPDFLAYALVVTSRFEEKVDPVPQSIIQPLRVAGNQLSTFMEAYLLRRSQQPDLFSDTEKFSAYSRLSAIVGERDVTILFAKLYAEQMIALKGKLPKEELESGKLPANIPDLVLSYLNELNKDAATTDPDNRTIHEAAKRIAWACLEKSYRPNPIAREAALARLAGLAGPDGLINYLDKRLRLIQVIEPAQDQISFTLDPLAEYLAGLYLIDALGDRAESWKIFLTKSDELPGAPESIKEFLMAVRDCCIVKGEKGGTPEFVVDELTDKMGMDPLIVQRFRLKQ